MGELLFGYVHDELAKEVEVEFSCNLFVDSFVYIVVLIWRLALPSLEMFVEFVDIFKQQMEDFFDGIINNTDCSIALGYLVIESWSSDEHALEDIDHLYLQLGVWYLLVNRHEDIENVCLIFGVSDRIEFRSENSEENNK